MLMIEMEAEDTEAEDTEAENTETEEDAQADTRMALMDFARMAGAVHRKSSKFV